VHDHIEILPQPDDSTCGPTCLHAVYRYYGVERDLSDLIGEVAPLETGGTLAVSLANHALRNGFRATIYTYNLQVFDPTWFGAGGDLGDKIAKRRRSKRDRKLRLACDRYLEFLSLGGEVRFEELTPALLRELLSRGGPVLTGLSATYLYESARELSDGGEDDVAGDPVGHFVVLSGYDAESHRVLVADPLHDNPRFRSPHYAVGLHRLISAILLGIVTYDANLLLLEPREA